MAAKKAVNLSKLSFSELKDKAKAVEGLAAMNRFEITLAVRRAEKQAVDPELEKSNPRVVKAEIKSLKARLAETRDKKARQELRRSVVKLKRNSRKYL
ncbi:MAG: hypothetical protein LBP33_06710 [Candidatus Adiutrix sp.]|jgi:CRISPR/Cas system CSM-associated protein Csm5 (group 7 of RAMP superfamily)|nr:hypothetical protein [Candidatus Adiutrix sp.]